jgi:aldehyde:ferredoxin oxidoreductase
MRDLQPAQYLSIDLSRSRSELLEVPPEVASEYPYGGALATWLLHTHLPQGTEPLSSQTPIVLVPGVFSGLPFPGATRMAVVTTSPLTGLWAGGVMGGEFAWALARTGWSALVVRGKAPESCFLLLDEGRVFFRKASHIEGCSLSRARDELKRDWGSAAAVLCVGPAGEAMVRYASLSDGTPEPGLRGGVGAVFGSKNLKAVVLRPHRGRSIEHPTDFLEKVSPLMKSLAATEKTQGSVDVLEDMEKAEALPGRNFQEVFTDRGWIESIRKLSSRRSACIGCPIACLKSAPVESEDDGSRSLTELALFSEHLWAAGPLVGLTSVEDTARILIRCRELGLDPISYGGVAAWAAETLEKGIRLGLDFKSDAGFGQVDWLVNLPDMIVTNPEVNELLGQGVRAAAQRIGGAASDLTAHYEGQELTYADPRRNHPPLSFLGPAFPLPLSPDLSLEATGEAAVNDLIAGEDRWALSLTLGLCPWAAMTQVELERITPELLRQVDGRDITGETLVEWSKNLINLIKAFDWHHDWRPFDQNLSARFFQEDLSSADRVFRALDPKDRRDQMKRYFSERGWQEDGRPIPEAHLERA